MYIKLTQNCDRCIILKSSSTSVTAYDSQHKPIKGIRKNFTTKIAEFCHDQKIEHPEISIEDSIRLTRWRDEQLAQISNAFLDNARGGKYGGIPKAKYHSSIGASCTKIGEFSGLIDGAITIDLTKYASEASETKTNKETYKFTTASEVKLNLLSLCEDILKRIEKDGKQFFSEEDARSMLIANSALTCALDSRGIGYIIKGSPDHPSPATEGLNLYRSIRRKILK
jgi:hypothetical protein